MYIHTMYMYIICTCTCMCVYSKSLPSVTGLDVYSSESDSDSGADSSRESKSRDGSRSRGSSGKEGKSKSSRSKGGKQVTSKAPNPEEIATAFKDTKTGSTFLPVPRVLQEKQRDKTSSSSSKLAHVMTQHIMWCMLTDPCLMLVYCTQ